METFANPRFFLSALLMTAIALAMPSSVEVQAQSYGSVVASTDEEFLIADFESARALGTVYVYRQNDDGWEEVQRLTASDGAPGDEFGSTIAVAGDDILVGTPATEDSRGGVYVFRKDENGTWAEVQKLTTSDGMAGEQFASVMAAANDIAAVSAIFHGDTLGAVYVFARDDNGNWSEEAKLTPEDGITGSAFGSSLATDGEYVLVGAIAKNEGQGAVHTFRRSEMGWMADGVLELETQTPDADAMEAEDAEPQEATGEIPPRFGTSLFLDGEILSVGAREQGLSGAVYSYERTMTDEGTTWIQTGEHRPLVPQEQMGFGIALAGGDGELWIADPVAAELAGRWHITSWNENLGEWSAPTVVEGLSPGFLFGGGISIQGDVGVVGIPGAHGTGSAKVVVREGNGGGWREGSELVGENRVSTVSTVSTVSLPAITGESVYIVSLPAITGEGVSTVSTGEIVSLPAITGEGATCEDGSADQFTCSEVDIVSFLPVQEIGGRVSDVWGWTDPVTGTEWALVGRYDGTSFIDLSDPANPRYVGNLPLTEGANPSLWRDIKVYKNHAFIVAEAADQVCGTKGRCSPAGEHGMQVFDLTQLRDVNGDPVTFEANALYSEIAGAHNVVINESTGFAYIVGAGGGGDTCGGGLHMVNIQDPVNPFFVGCFADAGYSHDAMCIIYEGPDEEHRGKEVCFGSNQTALSIADVSDKDNPIALAMSSYPNLGYSHQGWIDEEHEYFYMNDEHDELSGRVSNTRTLVWDVKDLDEPILVTEYVTDNRSSDHNLYIHGDLMYQSNYVSGLRIVDISDRESPREVGFFDTVPWGEDEPSFDGSWSNYPYFASGVIVVTSRKEGVFILRARRNLIP